MFALPLVPAIELLNLNDENFLSDESYEGVFCYVNDKTFRKHLRMGTVD